MKRAFCRLILFMLSATLVGAETWDVQKEGSFEYVKASQVKEFYGFSTLTVEEDFFELETSDLRFSFEEGRSVMMVNGIRHVLTTPNLVRGSEALIGKRDVIFLIDPILRPDHLKKVQPLDVIVIDPGHGGKDPGTQCALGYESELNLIIAKKVKAQLVKQLGDRVRVLLTRYENKTLSLRERVDIVTKYPNSIVVSIHGNGIGGIQAKSIEGVETFIMSPEGVAGYNTANTSSVDQRRLGNNFDQSNAILGTSIHTELIKALPQAKDRGLKRARFALVQAVPVPGVLIETGFLTHPEEHKRLFNEKYQDRIALAVTKGLVRYYNVSRFVNEVFRLREGISE